MAKVKYDALEHVKLIGTAIERMANNHTKWLLTLFTIIGFAITMDKFLWDLTPLVKLISYCATATILTIMMIIVLATSRKYFHLELMFRQKQSKVLKGEIANWDMNPTSECTAKRGSWIINVAAIMIGLFFLSQIIFITLGSLQVAGVTI